MLWGSGFGPGSAELQFRSGVLVISPVDEQRDVDDKDFEGIAGNRSREGADEYGKRIRNFMGCCFVDSTSHERESGQS